MRIHGKRSELADKVIELFYLAYDDLGPVLRKHDFAKKAMAHLFKGEKIAYRMNKPVQFVYKDTPVVNFVVDFLVEEKLVVHLYVTDELLDEHDREIYTYLKSADVHEGIMLNFGPEPDYIYKTADHYTRDKNVWTSPN